MDTSDEAVVDFVSLCENLANRVSLEDSKKLYDSCLSLEVRDVEFTHKVHEYLWRMCGVSLNRKDDPRDEFIWKSMIILQAIPEYDVSAALSTMPNNFPIQLLRSFDQGAKSSDYDRAKILRWLYYVSPSLRSNLRASIGQRILHIASHPDKLRRANLCPLLELMTDIITGMDITVSSSADILSNVLDKLLLPLHEPNYMIEWRDQVAVIQPYHEQLVHTVAHVCQLHAVAVSHDPRRSLLSYFFQQLLAMWPEGFNANTPKEILFLHEMEQLLEFCDDEEFSIVFPLLLDRLEKCLLHDNMLPIQRCLQMFKNSTFLRLVAPHSDDLIRRIVPALYRGETYGESDFILQLKLLQDMNESKCLEVSLSLAPAIVQHTSVSAPVRHSQPVDVLSGPPRHSKYRLPPQDSQSHAMEQWRPSHGIPPPVTITGIAPWAMVKPPQPIKSAPQPKLSESETPKNASNMIRNCDNILLDYMKLCKMHGGPEAKSGDWLQTQAASLPSRLPELRFHDLVFGKDIGEGSFGVVKYARHIVKGKTRSEWPEFAVKVLSITRMRTMGRNGFIAAAREIASLQSLTHPGIARLISAFRYTDCFYLVLEYAAKGAPDGTRRSVIFCRFVLGEICAALDSIHSKGLAFNDLKPENILITEIGHIKLTDFGACRAVNAEGAAVLEQGCSLISTLREGGWEERSSSAYEIPIRSTLDLADTSVFDEIEGTPAYLPPEVLHHGCLPGKKADSWALGAVMYFLLEGKPKYYGSREEVLSTIALESDNGQSVRFAAESIKESTLCQRSSHLLSLLLKKNPHERIHVSDAMIHPYITAGDEEGSIPLVASELHLRPPIELPSDNRGLTNGTDKAWARRQCSMVWAPLPGDYNIPSLPLKNTQGMTGGNNAPTAIPETSVERGSFFIPMTTGVLHSTRPRLPDVRE